MKTIVLDDDPTGTQSAAGVSVLLDWSGDLIRDALRADDSVYILTNSRAVPQAAAVERATAIRDAVTRAAGQLGEEARFVLRGDSTLRGHVFAESDVFATPASVLLLVPAFPAGGRVTSNGVHYVRVGSQDVPAGRTEYAADPVFGFTSSTLTGYVAEKGGRRPAVTVPLARLRATRGAAVTTMLTDAPPGTVVLPDAVTDDDIALIERGLEAAWVGRHIVVRCAAPLAAACAGVRSTGLLPVPLARPPGPVLLVCGSHTSGATAQLQEVEREYGCQIHSLDTQHALADPADAGRKLARSAAKTLDTEGLAVIASDRTRQPEHGTLSHGQQVMTALTTAVRELADGIAAVITKGGITSAEVAGTGFGARTARVRGQVLAGVSVWDLLADRDPVACVVVPGNVGDHRTLTDVLRGLLPGSR